MVKIFVKKLMWDEWNIDHIARHGVVKEEVEQLCQNEPIESDAHSGRIMLIGLTSNKRMISAILDPEPEEGIYYPVSARPSSMKERRIFKKERGDISDKN